MDLHDSASREMDDAANDGTTDKERTAAETINDWEDGAGGNEENNILYDRGSQSHVARLCNRLAMQNLGHDLELLTIPAMLNRKII